MTPSNQCKEAGLNSLAELTRISSVPKQTLIDWHKNKPTVFSCILAGAKAIKEAASD